MVDVSSSRDRAAGNTRLLLPEQGLVAGVDRHVLMKTLNGPWKFAQTAIPAVNGYCILLHSVHIASVNQAGHTNAFVYVLGTIDGTYRALGLLPMNAGPSSGWTFLTLDCLCDESTGLAQTTESLSYYNATTIMFYQLVKGSEK